MERNKVVIFGIKLNEEFIGRLSLCANHISSRRFSLSSFRSLIYILVRDTCQEPTPDSLSLFLNVTYDFLKKVFFSRGNFFP